MTNSAFVMDWSRPVPLEEFFLPAADVTIPAYRACVEHPDLRSRRFRITRQPNATANEQKFSSANLLNHAVDSPPDSQSNLHLLAGLLHQVTHPQQPNVVNATRCAQSKPTQQPKIHADTRNRLSSTLLSS